VEATAVEEAAPSCCDGDFHADEQIHGRLRAGSGHERASLYQTHHWRHHEVASAVAFEYAMMKTSLPEDRVFTLDSPTDLCFILVCAQLVWRG